MSSLKTFLVAGCLAVVLGAPAGAQSISHMFAGCVGRLSAAMEHAWLVGSDDGERYAEQRLAFLSLLDAVMSPDEARDVLAHRIEVKMAHASLLSLATFDRTSERAAGALSRAEWHLTACQKMMLPS